MTTPRIVITVHGGVVTGVLSDQPLDVQVDILDWDNREDNPEWIKENRDLIRRGVGGWVLDDNKYRHLL